MISLCKMCLFMIIHQGLIYLYYPWLSKLAIRIKSNWTIQWFGNQVRPCWCNWRSSLWKLTATHPSSTNFIFDSTFFSAKKIHCFWSINLKSNTVKSWFENRNDAYLKVAVIKTWTKLFCLFESNFVNNFVGNRFRNLTRSPDPF